MEDITTPSSAVDFKLILLNNITAITPYLSSVFRYIFLGNLRIRLWTSSGAGHRPGFQARPQSEAACAARRLSPKRQGMHLRRHVKLDGIQRGRSRRSSHPHSRNPGCLVARAARRLGALERRKRYLERVRYPGPLDFRGAHRLDAAAADHSGEWRSAAV